MTHVQDAQLVAPPILVPRIEGTLQRVSVSFFGIQSEMYPSKDSQE